MLSFSISFFHADAKLHQRVFRATIHRPSIPHLKPHILPNTLVSDPRAPVDTASRVLDGRSIFLLDSSRIELSIFSAARRTNALVSWPTILICCPTVSRASSRCNLPSNRASPNRTRSRRQ